MCLDLNWERQDYSRITNGAVDKTDEADRIERKSARQSQAEMAAFSQERDADVGWRENEE